MNIVENIGENLNKIYDKGQDVHRHFNAEMLHTITLNQIFIEAVSWAVSVENIST